MDQIVLGVDQSHRKSTRKAGKEIRLTPSGAGEFVMGLEAQEGLSGTDRRCEQPRLLPVESSAGCLVPTGGQALSERI